MDLWKSAEGMLTGELTGAETEKTLLAVTGAGICLEGIRWKDELTITFRCMRRDRRKMEEICNKRGDMVQFTPDRGIYYGIRKLLSRPVTVAGLLVLFGLTLFLPTRVLFVQVEGNDQLHTKQILEAAENCGLRFGASRRAVRSEKMKNALLAAMPQLKWAGINTAGCRAVLSVRERLLPEEEEEQPAVSSIGAVRDGYILSCTVTRGTGLCAPGQVVTAGDILISGYQDLGICLRATRAEGEIYAQTNHDFQAVTPLLTQVFTKEQKAGHRWSIILGKKRINLWKGSGIWDGTCGRMYTEYYITLPGGFRLPFCFVRETRIDRQLRQTEQLPDQLEEALKAFARQSVQHRMVAGQILREELSVAADGGLALLKGRFLCSEMIGRVITEEIGEFHGKTD